MGQYCCGERNLEGSSLTQIGGNAIRQSLHLKQDAKFKQPQYHDIESVYVERSESEKKKTQENLEHPPPLFNQVESMLVIEHEEEQQQVIELPQVKLEPEQKNQVSSIKLEQQKEAACSSEQSTKLDKQKSIETLLRARSNLNALQIQEVQETKIEEQQIQDYNQINNSQPYDVEVEYQAPQPKIWTYEEKYKYVPDCTEESHQISFSNNFNTVTSNDSNIEERLKKRAKPGKLSLIFLKALEKSILGKSTAAAANQQEPELQIVERPVRKCRPRQPQQVIL